MPLPPEIQERLRSRDVLVSVKTPSEEKVIIEGKTSIPFGSFVKLVLQRKIQKLYKSWLTAPIILDSELLTSIASAPEDTVEDKSKIILTALVIGFCFGMFITGFVLILLGMVGVTIGQKELLTGLTVLLAIALAVHASARVQATRAKEKILEKVEQVAEVFSK